MLKNIPSILSPELLKILMEMGPGDEIAIAAGNFPAASHAQRLVRCDGQASNDGYFVSEAAAKEGVIISNHSQFQPMVILKNFGPNHPDMPKKVGHFPAPAAEALLDNDGKWYISRAGWGRGGLYLAPLIWKDSEPETESK